MSPEQIARVTHDANRSYCQSIGDDSQKTWDEAEQWQRDSAITGVLYALGNPNVTSEEMHDSWSAQKEATGWKYGIVKDSEKKQHPCLVSYSELPAEQQRKDALFSAIVSALREK